MSDEQITDPQKQFELGYKYFEGGSGVEQDFKKAYKWFKLSAEQGHAEAQYCLGACYLNGNGVEQDFKKAIEWFKLSAEQGNAEAQYCLGACYLNGNVAEPDYKKVFKWFKLSAEQGHARAECNLGFFYSAGCGVDRDLKKALEIFYKFLADNVPTTLSEEFNSVSNEEDKELLSIIEKINGIIDDIRAGKYGKIKAPSTDPEP